MYCESCGKKVGAGVKFCKNCGSKVRTREQITADIINDFKNRSFDSIKEKIKSIETGSDRDFIRRIEGDLAFVKGSYKEARANYGAIPKNKKTWDVLFNLALINLNDNMIDEALECLRAIKPQEADPKDSLIYSERYPDKNALLAEIQLYLGILHKSAGRMGPAIKNFEKALGYGDDNELVHANLGDAYFKNDEYDRAIAHYETL
jgi:tetratricopeptide (TPR) repeat protein